MHKPFYASGFFYHSPTQQILLQHLPGKTEKSFSLFGVKNHTNETPRTVFQRYIEKITGHAIPTDSICPIYDYVADHLGEQFIFYVEVATITNDDGWFSLSKLSKRGMSDQTRHDIIVGERVIRAKLESVTPQR